MSSGGNLLAGIKAQLEGLVDLFRSVNARLDAIEADSKRAAESRHADALEGVKDRATIEAQIKDLKRDILDLKRGHADVLEVASEARAIAEAVKERDTVSKSTLLWTMATGALGVLGTAAIMAWWSGLLGA